jgi:hypothetical protein
MKSIRGCAWLVSASAYGAEAIDMPGHPFFDDDYSKRIDVGTPGESIEFYPLLAEIGIEVDDGGGANFLSITKGYIPPTVNPTWEVEPAKIDPDFETEGGHIRLVRITGRLATSLGRVTKAEFEVAEDEGE